MAGTTTSRLNMREIDPVQMTPAGGSLRKEKSGIVNVEELVVEAARWRNHSIYRVPAYVKNERYVSPYEPQLVSLGPFYNGRLDLVPMEEHKHRALLRLVGRSGRPVEELVEALEKVVELLKDAYMDLDDRWRLDPAGFLRVMLMDGCFLLEVMRTAMDDEKTSNYEYEANDPVFSGHGELYMFPHIRRDMLMMENQLPLLVLQRLVAVVFGPDEATDDAINNKVLKFLSLMPNSPELRDGGLALHPIDVCHRSLLQLDRQPRKIWKGRRDEFGRSATELDQAGVHLMKSLTRSLRDISFLRGVLYIPALTVDNYTEHKLFNLMAFERLHASAGATANEVTAYVFFMDTIIKSTADAQLVCSKGIILNGLGSDKELAKMFNRLANKAVLGKCSPLRAVHGQVNAYCDKRWNQWRASLIRKHAENPWAVVSLVAAVFLLALTVLQTVYTLLPYYQKQTDTG